MKEPEQRNAKESGANIDTIIKEQTHFSHIVTPFLITLSKNIRKRLGAPNPIDIIEENKEIQEIKQYIISQNYYLYLTYHQMFDELFREFGDKGIYDRAIYLTDDIRVMWAKFEEQRKFLAKINYMLPIKNMELSVNPFLTEFQAMFNTTLTPINMLFFLEQNIKETKVEMHYQHAALLDAHYNARSQRMENMIESIASDDSMILENKKILAEMLEQYQTKRDALVIGRQNFLKTNPNLDIKEKRLAEFKGEVKALDDEFHSLFVEFVDTNNHHKIFTKYLNIEIDHYQKLIQEYEIILNKHEKKINEDEGKKAVVLVFLNKQIDHELSKIEAVINNLNFGAMNESGLQQMEKGLQSIVHIKLALPTFKESSSYEKAIQDYLINLKDIKSIVKTEEDRVIINQAENALRSCIGSLGSPQVKNDLIKLDHEIQRQQFHDQQLASSQISIVSSAPVSSSQYFREQLKQVVSNSNVNELPSNENNQKLLDDIKQLLQEMISTYEITSIEDIGRANKCISACSDIENSSLDASYLDKFIEVQAYLNVLSEYNHQCSSLSTDTQSLIEKFEQEHGKRNYSQP